MNKLMQEKWPWIEGTNTSRLSLLDLLTDGDLAFNPGGQNIALGAQFREMGDVEYSYIQSLKNFTQDFNYHNTETGIESSVALLKSWYTKLDQELQTLLSAFSDEDATKTIDRSGYPVSVAIQLDVYLQALLIFLAKVSIYFKAMNKALPEGFDQFI